MHVMEWMELKLICFNSSEESVRPETINQVSQKSSISF